MCPWSPIHWIGDCKGDQRRFCSFPVSHLTLPSGPMVCPCPPSGCGFPCGCTPGISRALSCILFLRSISVLTQENKKKKTDCQNSSKLPKLLHFYTLPSLQVKLKPQENPPAFPQVLLSLLTLLQGSAACQGAPSQPSQALLQCPPNSLLFLLLAGVGCEGCQRHRSRGTGEQQRSQCTLPPHACVEASAQHLQNLQQLGGGSLMS